MVNIEEGLRNNTSDVEYKKRLLTLGLKPKTQFDITIPAEAQQVALEALFSFTENTKLEYAYQMLLLLVMLKRVDKHGEFSVIDTAHCFAEFYRLRREAGLPAEKRHGLKQAVVDNPNVTTSRLCQMLKINPFPRFERQGLLELNEDDRYFVVNPALLGALTPGVRENLWWWVIGWLVVIFGVVVVFIVGLVAWGGG